jgi:hypothetical protein
MQLDPTFRFTLVLRLVHTEMLSECRESSLDAKVSKALCYDDNQGSSTFYSVGASTSPMQRNYNRR